MTSDFVIVFSAEFVRRLKSRPFQLGVILGILGILAFTKLPALMTGALTESGSTIVLAGNPVLAAAAKPLLARDFKVAAVTRGAAPPSAADLRAHDASSWVTLAYAARGGLRFTLYSRNPKETTAATIARDLRALNLSLGTALPKARIDALLDVPYAIHGIASKFASSRAATAAWVMSYFLLMLLYMLILINSQLVMSSVAEEKTSRIAELLIASISPTSLLYGKIAAATAAGLLQMACWVVAGIALASFGAPSTGTQALAAAGGGFDAGNLLSSAVSAPELAAFVVLFGLGFLQYSMLFAGIGSLINRTEDLGSISLPIVLPVIAGLFLAVAALGVPDAPWAVAASFVPLISPFVLFARIAMSDVPTWQTALGLLINVGSAWAIAALAGKLYRVGMLLYGRPPTLKQIWSVVRS